MHKLYRNVTQTSLGTETHLDGMVTSFGCALSCSLRMRIRYWVIFVRRCLFLWTRNLGQYWANKEES